jgi:hypothetical protein
VCIAHYDNLKNIRIKLKVTEKRVETKMLSGVCEKYLTDELSVFMQDVFDGIDDTLFHLADVAENSSAQKDYFDAMRLVRKQRQEILEDFSSAVILNFEGFWETGRLIDLDEKFLLGDRSTDPEEILAIHNMVAKADKHNKGILSSLSRRLAKLRSQSVVDNKNNPFSARAMCYAIFSVSHKLSISIESKLVVLKMFESYVMDRIETLYEAINTELLKMGDDPRAENFHPARSNKKQASQYVEAESEEDKAVIQSELQAVGLEALEKALTPNTPVAVNENLEMVSVVFDYILEDRHIPVPIKVLLRQLQGPYLKMCAQDQQLFSQKNHPARLLLNELASTGQRWNESEGRETGGVFHKIETVVKKIISHKIEVQMFSDLLEEFSGFIAKESDHAQIVQRRTEQVSIGKEQLQIAKLRTEHEINEVVFDKIIPQNIMQLVNMGWHDVLLYNYMKHGSGSSEWQSALDVLHDLIWSVQIKELHQDKQKLLHMIPVLLEKIRQGLENISCDKKRISLFLKELQTYQIQLLRGNTKIPVLGVEQVVAKGRVSKHESPVKMSEDDAELMKNVKVNTWLEYPENENSHVRAKVSWMSTVTGRVVLVNRKGGKVAEILQKDLALLLKTGKAQILDEKPLVDRAIDK